MSSTISYSLSDFKNIKGEGFVYELPEYALLLINKISRQVGAPSYVKTPVFKKHRYYQDGNGSDSFNKNNGGNYARRTGNSNNNYKNKRVRNNKKHGMARELTDDEWNTIRNFEATKMEKAKDDCEQALNDIRSLLNKVSESNYELIRDEIMFKLYELQQLDILDVSESSKLWGRICELVINTSYSNAFYSDQYVKLLKVIYNKYETIENQFKQVLDKCMETFYDIEYVDPEQDYDRFCENNIVTKNRRALATFIANLYRNELIKDEEYSQIIQKVLITFTTSIEEQNKQHVCEELAEIIFSLIDSNYALFKNQPYDDYFTQIEEFSMMKAKNKPSLTNKIIFKLCDIVDAVGEL